MNDMETKICVGCERRLPTEKFNLESGSPDHCFRCRIRTVNIGFNGYREQFHGDNLHGGTVASDNRHTISEARSNGLDPVPVKAAEANWVPGASQAAKLKKALGG